MPRLCPGEISALAVPLRRMARQIAAQSRLCGFGGLPGSGSPADAGRCGCLLRASTLTLDACSCVVVGRDDAIRDGLRCLPYAQKRTSGLAFSTSALMPLAEAMLMAEFVCIRRALSVARKRLETGPA